VKRALRRLLLWSVVAPALLVLAVRAFVGDVYYVDSRSMEPVLHGDETGGEYVFVRFDDHPRPRRFDLVVLDRRGSDELLVKRVVGVGGESVQLAGGDLYVEGKLLPPGAPRPPLVPVFDSRIHDLAERFRFDDPRSFVRTGDGWRIQAGESARAAYAPRLTDDYLAPGGAIVRGDNNANDAAVELALRLEPGWKRWEIVLTEEDDRFSLSLLPAAEGRATAALLRWTPDDAAPRVLERAELDLDPSREHRIGFHNLDNELAFELDGAPVLRHVYGQNTPIKTRGEGGYVHALPRIELRAGELRAELRRLRVWRDVVYYEHGTFGTARAVTLAPDEVFVVGDNSGESRDSRHWGPSSLDDVIGRPTLVVWPPSRWRAVR
jgi:signal peptidase I